LTITINFDPHLIQAFMPLVVGGGLVIATPEGHTSASYVVSTMKEQGVTHYNSTPSLALLQFAGEDARECTALRCVMFGGEQLPREVISLFAEKVSLVSFTQQIFCIDLFDFKY
jgi:non-ribosomal peptide synthetase component F